MKNSKPYPMYDSKDYPLYCDFVTAFRTEYPEEDIDDITEYFMNLLCEPERETIHLYIALYELKRRGLVS